MQDILLLFASEDSEKWKDYILDVLCKNDLNLTVVCKDLQKDEEEILRISSDFLVVSILVSPAMLDTMSPATRLAPVLDVHACVTVILLYTDITDLDTELGQNFRNLKSWKSFDITNKPDIENKKAISEIVDLLEKEREHKRRLQPTPPDPRPRSSGKSGGARSVRTILKAVCPERVVKVGGIKVRPKKKKTSVFRVVMSLKIVGRVGKHIFVNYYFYWKKYNFIHFETKAILPFKMHKIIFFPGNLKKKF